MTFLLLLAALQGKAAPELPASGWVNGPELDLERFRGKAVLLCFFEPTCSNVRELVPALNDLALKLASKPAVFLAVSSGTSRRALEEFAKATRFSWPILCDTDRSVEERYGLKISLSNIYWYVVVAPDGTWRGFGADLAATESHLDALLPAARMLFDGLRVPPALEPLRWHLERGYRGDLIRDLFKAAGRDDAVAAKMYDRLRTTSEAMLDRARSLEGKADPVSAWAVFAQVGRDFPGTPQGAEGVKQADRLRKTRDVKAEILARTVLDQAEALEEKGKHGRAQARALLESLVQSAPQAPSAEKARRRLAGAK